VVSYEQIETLIGELALENLQELEYVTTYRGKPLDPGTQSGTMRLMFRSPTRTLAAKRPTPRLPKSSKPPDRDFMPPFAFCSTRD
jgi:hypothetical protein